MKDSDQFMEYVAKNMDGRTFTVFMKFLNELRADVLNDSHHKLSPDSFMIFIDKIRGLTSSDHLNNMVIAKMERVDLNQLSTK